MPKQCAYQKNLLTLYQRNQKKGMEKKSNMNVFIICFSLAALLYVLTLPFIGKRGKKEKTKQKPNYRSWEANAIEYNRMHGLPDDAI